MMDIHAILKQLPHRYPFLLVDKVTELERNTRIKAIKNVTFNEPYFMGHFPGRPVMPGVLILEALAQASAILAYKSEGFDPAVKLSILMGIDGARFRRRVVPGDRLELVVEVIKHKGAIWKQRGTARVDGQKVAEAEFLATVVDRADLPAGEAP
jgi:3-hydroxyacyl-[acyl-carrier-protein] dehydratase